jgi:hypothetical protein
MENDPAITFIFLQGEETINRLIRERLDFENEMYDYLLEPINILIDVDDSFWEPVHVGYNKVKELKDIITEDDCCICTEKHLNFKSIRCCNQKMCNNCCYTWFEKSVKCPFCQQDIRDFEQT